MWASEYYCRQTVLKEVGLEGQLKLGRTRALIVGAGGLGHPVATYLAAAGVGEIAICDFDRVEAGNLNRQVCFCLEDIGTFKAEALAQNIRRQNPLIRIQPLVKKIDPTNVEAVLAPFDLILDCCDNIFVKYLIHDTCWSLEKDLCQAAIHQYEGQLQTFFFSRDRNSGCWRCLWEDVPSFRDTCGQTGLIGSVAGVLGTLQASAAIKLILDLGDNHPNETLIFSFLDMSTQKIRWNKSGQCPLCSSKAKEKTSEKFEVDFLDEQNYCLVDVREHDECAHDEHPGHCKAARLPLSEVDSWKRRLDPKKSYLFFCTRGIRSFVLAESLRRENLPRCYSLSGGLESLQGEDETPRDKQYQQGRQKLQVSSRNADIAHPTSQLPP